MKFILKLSFLLITFCGTAQIHTNQRHDWRQQFKKKSGTVEFANMVPDSIYTTVKKQKGISGQVISICAGNDTHWYPGPVEVGVIIIYSSKEKLTYCVLTSTQNKYNYVAGDSIKIKVAPLTKKDKYFQPRQLTCDGIKGDIICVAKN